jgi:hypothetical protein
MHSDASEQRMLEQLATRTAKLEDVLDAERELARIREESKACRGSVSCWPTETTKGLRNSLVEGLSGGGLLVFLFALGPSILFWWAVFLVPGSSGGVFGRARATSAIARQYVHCAHVGALAILPKNVETMTFGFHKLDSLFNTPMQFG